MRLKLLKFLFTSYSRPRKFEGREIDRSNVSRVGRLNPKRFRDGWLQQWKERGGTRGRNTLDANLEAPHISASPGPILDRLLNR